MVIILTDVGQVQQDSEPEVSDGEEISGSDDEKAPVLRRTGGPKKVEEDSWPMGPDYPSEPIPVQSSTSNVSRIFMSSCWKHVLSD